MLALLLAIPAEPDLNYLRTVAMEVIDGCAVRPEETLKGGQKNTTGQTLRVPGATREWYPAFWVRDAAMMLGADFVSAPEIEGWIKVIAAVQPDAEGVKFGKLTVPGFSIPDHIALSGAACWYPGAYEEQGNGSFGFLPPADDAFYFIQMVAEHVRLTKSTAILEKNFPTAGGAKTVREICAGAYASVATEDGIVVCEAEPERTRVDWGFNDSIRKTGKVLMPTLLRWQAARDLAAMLSKSGRKGEGKWYAEDAAQMAKGIEATFYHELAPGRGILLSATGVGRKADLWASSYAVWLGVLPGAKSKSVSAGLLDYMKTEPVVFQGQVRALPTKGALGGHWDSALSGPETYQNGGFWGTPTGWFVYALRKVDRAAGDAVLRDYVAHIRAERAKGAPFEWVHSNGARQNPHYAASAGLVYSALMKR